MPWSDPSTETSRPTSAPMLAAGMKVKGAGSLCCWTQAPQVERQVFRPCPVPEADRGTFGWEACEPAEGAGTPCRDTSGRSCPLCPQDLDGCLETAGGRRPREGPPGFPPHPPRPGVSATDADAHAGTCSHQRRDPPREAGRPPRRSAALSRVTRLTGSNATKRSSPAAPGRGRRAGLGSRPGCAACRAGAAEAQGRVCGGRRAGGTPGRAHGSEVRGRARQLVGRAGPEGRGLARASCSSAQLAPALPGTGPTL